MLLIRIGTVAAVHRDRAYLTFDELTHCPSCAGGTGCGVGSLVAMFRSGARPAVEMQIPATINLNPGDRVRVGMSAASLLRAASYAYLLPLAGLITGAGLGAAAGAGDGPALVGALVGLLASATMLMARGVHGLDYRVLGRQVSEASTTAA